MSMKRGLLNALLLWRIANSRLSTDAARSTASAAASSAADAKPVLYSFWRSSCSYRVRLYMNLKNIPYDIKPVNIVNTKEQLSDDYRQVNPMQLVPALRIDGHTLIESLAIMYYLEETRPEQPLLPQDVYERTKVREICEVICSGIQPLQNVGVLRLLDGDEKRLEWAQRWINRGFRAIEQLLSTSAGKYAVGDEITLADCCLIPQVYNARRYHVDLTPYSTIERIDRELESNPAFQAAHPSNQPDCPPDFARK